jgi:hypothetical protein
MVIGKYVPSMNLAGENGASSAQVATPSQINSAIAFPETGAHRIPQQLCAHCRYAPLNPGTRPMTGSASGEQGRLAIF